MLLFLNLQLSGLQKHDTFDEGCLQWLSLGLSPHRAVSEPTHEHERPPGLFADVLRPPRLISILTGPDLTTATLLSALQPS